MEEKILRKIHLQEYHPDYPEAVFYVWVNPPRKTRDQLVKAMDQIAATKKIGNQAIFECLSVIWSQGPEENHMTIGEVRDLFDQLHDRDPRCWYWLTLKTFEMVKDHLARVDAERSTGAHLN